jgi:Ca-activated chloride channel family protein
MGQQIAQAGDGVYVRADNSNIALRTISKQLSQIQKGEIQTTAFADYADKFYIFAWIAFFILVIEFFILNRQNKQLNKYKWF